MSRLPPALQPAWPLVKRAHRLASLLLGLVFRRTSRAFGARALPRAATTSSRDTALREPAAVTVHGSPERYVLEVRDGLLVGDFAATVTPGGVLDYATSGYFGISGWREHPVFLRPTLPPVEHVAGTVVSLATRGTTANYYHFLLDALPRWGILRAALPDVTPDAVVVPHGTGYQRHLLAMVGLDALPLVAPRSSRTLRADRLLVPSTPNQELDAPPWVVDWLRRSLPASPGSRPARRLYVTRGMRPRTRRLVTEPELWPLLEERGFERVDPGTLSVQEQIDLFASAEVVVGPHGAGLSNLVFAPAGVRVVELFAADYVNPCYRAIVQRVPGSSYRPLVDSDREARAMTGVLTDVRVPPRAVVDALDELGVS